jgi:hypothetical protein
MVTRKDLRGLAVQAGRGMLLPFWAAQVLTGAKSFMDNPVIGSPMLNEKGLHTRRVLLAHRLAASRRRRLAHLLAPSDRAAFDRDGYIAKPDFLPPEQFSALLGQVRGYRGYGRETIQGNAVTRRIALDPRTLDHLPAVRQLLAMPEWRGLIRYAGSFDAEPITYIQTILSHAQVGPDDPQCTLHADTFHSTVKAWLFLTDVPEDKGPFTYVAGSHRMTPERQAWERQVSLGMAEQPDRLTRRGSFRVQPEDLAQMGLPHATKLAVSANTLVVADTHGFHARGQSAGPTQRVEIWASGRRNPFLPWTGLDPWTIDALGQRRTPMFWRTRDALQALGIQPNHWRKMTDMSAFDP